MPELPRPRDAVGPPRRRFVGLAAALAGAALLVCLGVVIRLRTAEGTLVVEVEDPGVTVRVDGGELVIDGAGVKEFRVGTGTHTVKALRGETPVLDRVVSVERNGKTIVTVRREPETRRKNVEYEVLSDTLKLGLTGEATAEGPPPTSANPEGDPKGKALLRVLEGHTGTIRSLAFLPDGRRAVSGAWDGEVRIWDVQGQRPPVVLDAKAGGVNRVAASPDGRRVAAAFRSGIAIVWDVTGKTAEVCRLKGHEGAVEAVAFAPDGRRILTGGADGTVRIWNIETGRECGPPGHATGVKSAAFTPDGRRVVTGGEDWIVRIWDSESGKVLHELKDHSGPVLCVAVSADGRLVASAGTDGRVFVRELGTMKLVLKFEGHDVCEGLAFTPDGHRLLTCGQDRMVRTWDLATGREETRFHRSANVVAVAVAHRWPDGDLRRRGQGRVGLAAVRRGEHAGHFPRVPRRPYEHGC